MAFRQTDQNQPSSPPRPHLSSPSTDTSFFIRHLLPPPTTTMSAIVESIQKMRTSQSLPVSHSDPDSSSAAAANGGLRRRLSSLSLNLQSAPSLSASWAAASFRRTKSLSSMGDAAGTSLRRWWDWGWTWILSKKPVFAQDLEMNEEEARAIGSNSRGSWKHVLFKVRSEIRKLVGSDAHMGLPQTIRQ